MVVGSSGAGCEVHVASVSIVDVRSGVMIGVVDGNLSGTFFTLLLVNTASASLREHHNIESSMDWPTTDIDDWVGCDCAKEAER